MERPNILLLHTDQQRWDALGANGNGVIKTPHLDELAGEGVNFTRCICQNPVCMPSRVSLLTGAYCSSLKITHMAVPVPPETMTIQKIVKRYGYHTALIGKLHFLPHANRDHRELHPRYDFDHMELSDEPGCYEDAYRAWVRSIDPMELDNISVGLPPATEEWQRLMSFVDGIRHPERLVEKVHPFPGRDDLTHTAFVGQRTIDFLRRKRGGQGEPFFCFSGFYSPHSPCLPPRRYFDLYDTKDMPLPEFSADTAKLRSDKACSDREIQEFTRAYYGAISEVDHWIGSIVQTLKEEGLWDNTVVVFTSDHGEWCGEHLRYGKGYWAPDCVSRVPLIVRVPEGRGGAAGRKVDDIVECVDIVPTLLDTAAVPIEPHVQGDLLPVTRARTACAGDGLGLCEGTGTGSPIPGSWKALRGPGYHYVVNADGSERLYDMEKDPHGLRDVAKAPQYSNRLQEARLSLLGRMLRIEQPLKREWPY